MSCVCGHHRNAHSFSRDEEWARTHETVGPFPCEIAGCGCTHHEHDPNYDEDAAFRRHQAEHDEFTVDPGCGWCALSVNARRPRRFERGPMIVRCCEGCGGAWVVRSRQVIDRSLTRCPDCGASGSLEALPLPTRIWPKGNPVAPGARYSRMFDAKTGKPGA